MRRRCGTRRGGPSAARVLWAVALAAALACRGGAQAGDDCGSPAASPFGLEFAAHGPCWLQDVATPDVSDSGSVPVSHPPEITPAAQEAIAKGLRYLASTQNRDGSWRTRGSTGGYPVAMTSLAGLALLAGGSTPTQGPYARNVSSALTCVLNSARRDGLIARLEEESHCMHGHGFAMLFLAQCYGMEEDPRRAAQIRLVLQRAVELTARSQSAAGGWLYTPDAGGDEGSVTVTQVQGLRACRNAGIAVPKRVIDNAMRYLDRSANPDGGIRYQVSDTGPSRPAITAAAVACWFNAGIYDDPRPKKALDFIERTLSPGRTSTTQYFGHYYYAHLYMAQVMYLVGADKWQAYFPAMRDRLLGQQSDDGSWPGDQVGPTYGTAVVLIILQLPYKHLPIMQR
ncbi:MAG TPA: prenyltransferase/squalene oxidase repeat-containing protein [Phycisphaerae bacterium]|nr:prenyltransferase/squalene oxidase repeat-containing protein [Phycisphaerae bacterium]